MRIKVTSTDRIGISQEILGEISRLGLNLVALEVASGMTYLHLDSQPTQLAQIKAQLLTVHGVISCDLIELLPTESREQHLQMLLKRIPDPIFDVNANGTVLSCNYQSHLYQAQHIEKLLNIPFEKMKARKPFTTEVSFEESAYHAEVSPIWIEGSFNGAVVLLKSLNRIGQQLAMLQRGNDSTQLNDILGNSPAITKLKQQALKLSVLDLPLLIRGETGTGKELVARAIHQQSPRKDGPFLAINCASLPEQLLESELFGYAAGAFTGASEQGKPGLLELANEGTVFLDEVAEMSIYLQAKLLRFLQDYSFRRLGGTKELFANVRIISASHQAFENLVTEGKFREDLYYRLNVLNLTLPPLRERGSDISLLCHHFLAEASKQVNMPNPNISPQAIAFLSGYSWPGNIRQVQSVMFRLAALNSSEAIKLEDVKEVLATFTLAGPHTELEQQNFEFDSWQDAQAQFEKQLLTRLYPQYPSTRKLAERLKVSHNKIAMKLRQYGL